MAVPLDQPVVASRVLGVARSHATQTTVLLIALTVWMFGSTLTGDTIPPFDFVGAYNSEDFAWWGLGGVLNPPDWMPYFWGGYPASTNLQNGAWYLPVGVASMLADYDLHVAAVVQVAHIVFGAVGMYVLARRLGRTHIAALIAMVGWYFSAGFFWTAQLVDFLRGFAWMPWLLLVFSTGYPWRRWWSIPLAAMMISQAAIGTYPGELVAFIYALPIWAAINLWRRQGADRISAAVESSAAVLAAGVLFLPKLVPFLLTRGMSYTQDDAMTFGANVIGTAFFAPEYEQLPFPDFHFYSLFLPCVVFVMWCWVSLRDRVVQAALLVALVCLVLGISTLPWHDAVGRLPATNLSRFPFSDFRVPLLAVTTLGAAYGFDRLLDGAAARSKRETACRIGLSLVVVAGAVTLAARIGYVASTERRQVTLLALAVILAAVGAVAATSLGRRRLVGALLVCIAVASGAVSSLAQRTNWASDRRALEVAAFGSEIDSFIDSPDVEDATRRPGRDAPQDFPVAGELAVPGGQDRKYNRYFYTGDLAIFAYVNIRAVAPYNGVKFSMATADPERNERALDFWRAPGLLIEFQAEFPSSDATDACVDTSACGPGIVVSPVSYRNNGAELTYRVTSSRNTTLAANEAFYDGWRGQLCPAQESSQGCVAVEPYSSAEAVLLIDVPAGDWYVKLTYRLPGLRATWLLAAATLLALAGHAGWRISRGRRAAAPEDEPHEVERVEPHAVTTA